MVVELIGRERKNNCNRGYRNEEAPGQRRVEGLAHQQPVAERRVAHPGRLQQVHHGMQPCGPASGLDEQPERCRRKLVEGVAVGQDEPPDPRRVGVENELAQRAAGVVADESDVIEPQCIEKPDDQPRHPAGAEVGVGPEVVAWVPSQGWLVARFIEGSPVSVDQMRRPETMDRVAGALRRFHQAAPIPGGFDAHEVVELVQDLRKHPSKMISRQFFEPEALWQDHPTIRDRILFIYELFSSQEAAGKGTP